MRRTTLMLLIAIAATNLGCDDSEPEPPCLQTIEDETRALLLDAPPPITTWSTFYVGAATAMSCVTPGEFCDDAANNARDVYRHALEYQLACLEQR